MSTELRPAVVDADPAGTTYRDPDSIPLAELSPVERAYCTSAEQRAGTVSRRVLSQRIRATEGDALAAVRRAGRSVAIRAAAGRDGIQHTDVAGWSEPAQRTAR